MTIDYVRTDAFDLDPRGKVRQPKIRQVWASLKRESLPLEFISPAAHTKHHGISGFQARAEVTPVETRFNRF
jgi:hypothetical protein